MLLPEILVRSESKDLEMWVDATQDSSAIEFEITRTFGNDDYAIVDSDDFGPYTVSNKDSISDISELGKDIEYSDSLAPAAFAELVGIEYYSDWEDHFCGIYDNFETFVETILDEEGIFDFLASKNLDSYLNISAIATDWLISSYDIVEYEGYTYVFSE